MSKDKPEVGDVWVSDCKTRVIVIFVDKYEVEYYYLWGSYLQKDSETYSCFIDSMTYLGKAKYSIEDLFKTENE